VGAEFISLCAVGDLPEGACRGFSVDTGCGYQDVFLVHKAGRINAYLNSCPHTGGPLDWVPDQFLDLDGELIQCATHHALFRIEDGLCVAGPCSGKSLEPVAVEIRDGEISLRVETG
jgi:nitrite reductase/ring-hydroxylating ferredoxin subunit